MKSIHILSITFLFCLKSNFVFSQKSGVDTIFLTRNENQKVFVEPSKKSERYKTLSDFSFAEFQEESYQSQISELISAETEFKKMNYGQMPKKWVRCYLYKGKPFLYYPCDFIHYSAAMFTDSTFLHIGGEGPDVYPMISCKIRSDKSYLIKAKGMEIIIHPVIISGKAIAVFETYYLYEGETERIPIYSLMTDARNIYQLPMIVNECDFQKELEFKLDDPDYTSILRKNKLISNHHLQKKKTKNKKSYLSSQY